MNVPRCVAKLELATGCHVIRLAIDGLARQPNPAQCAVTDGAVSSFSSSSRLFMISAANQSFGFTIGFHNHGEDPYYGLYLVKSAY